MCVRRYVPRLTLTLWPKHCIACLRFWILPGGRMYGSMRDIHLCLSKEAIDGKKRVSDISLYRSRF